MTSRANKVSIPNTSSAGCGNRHRLEKKDMSMLSLLANLSDCNSCFDSVQPTLPRSFGKLDTIVKHATTPYSVGNVSFDAAKIKSCVPNRSKFFDKSHMSVYLGTDGDETTRADNLAHMWHANFFGMNWPNKKLCTEIMIQMVSKMTDSSRSEAILNLLLQQKTNLLTDIIAQALLKMDFMSRAEVIRRLPLPQTSISRKRPASDHAPICVTREPKPPVVVSGLKNYWSNKRQRTTARHDPFKRPELVRNAQSCLACGKKIPRGVRRPYTHQKSNGSFYVIYRCCGKDYSDLKNLSGLRNKHFQGLKPVKHELTGWSFDKKFNKWRLMARGQSWTRCNHCKALYKNFSGKSGHHPTSKCAWAYLNEAEAEEAAANSVTLAIASATDM